jgi:hypothetical protein
MVKKSSDDNDDSSYISSEKKELKRNENERQDIDITAEKSNDSESEVKTAEKIKKRHVYQNMKKMKVQKR